MKVKFNNKTYNLPDFLIVGAAKSGTTSLHYYLKNQEEIFLPEIKESYFFSFYDSPPNFNSPDPLFDIITDLEKYSSQFPSNFQGHIGDASPSYLYSYEKTIDNIKYIYGENYRKLKIIILLRNPVDRAWSQYMHFKKNYNEPLSFNKAISEEVILERLSKNWNYFYDYIGFGMYSKQVSAYLSEFSNVKLFLFEELKKDSDTVLKETLEFIGCKNERVKTEQEKVFNISGIPKRNFYSYLWRLKKVRILKSVLRVVFPSKIKNNLNNFLLSRSLKRTSISNNNRMMLMNIYRNEILNLEKTITKPGVKNWINK